MSWLVNGNNGVGMAGFVRPREENGDDGRNGRQNQRKHNSPPISQSGASG
jgi:hypothetical protein